MRISELADRTAVPASTLRFYESAGLLPADRTANGYRSYGPDALERLEFIGAAKGLGLSLEDIGELLPIWQDGPCARVKAELRPRLRARLDQAEGRLAELRSFIATLYTALERLDGQPDRDERCDAECCFPAVESAEWQSAPIACTLGDGDRTERAERWQVALDGGTRTEIPDGLRVTVPADRAGMIAELAVAEQQCCAFFDFRLHLDGPAVQLEIRTPGAGVAMLAELFA
ncbi:MerR family transcriptional regulator [Nocardia sp. NPDC020380]|uniref:MerR family transcriptional regulator n=1 Tax=Nocardia sp. NPDC020380 TaxID=3364309 RepID=UPI00379CC9DD